MDEELGSEIPYLAAADSQSWTAEIENSGLERMFQALPRPICEGSRIVRRRQDASGSCRRFGKPTLLRSR